MSIDYPLYDQLSHWLSAQGIQVLDSTFATDVTVEVRVLATEAEAVIAAITELTHGNAELLVGEEAFQPLVS